jgi:nucleotide-binding universal stress UspA family protein
MASIQHILVALDFSESSRLALEYAELLARQFGAAVDLVHVVTTLVSPMPGGCAPPFFSDPGESHLVEARACLENHADELRSRGLSVATLLLEGSPLESILGQAQKPDPDTRSLETKGPEK